MMSIKCMPHVCAEMNGVCRFLYTCAFYLLFTYLFVYLSLLISIIFVYVQLVVDGAVSGSEWRHTGAACRAMHPRYTSTLYTHYG